MLTLSKYQLRAFSRSACSVVGQQIGHQPAQPVGWGLRENGSLSSFRARCSSLSSRQPHRSFARKGSTGIRKGGFLEHPFDVPTVQPHNGREVVKNIFVLDNPGSKFIMLNRPEANNALTLEMLQELYQILGNVEQNYLCNMVLLYGAGEKAFCAGGDVLHLTEGGPVPLDREHPAMEFFKQEYLLDHRIATMPNKSVVSVMQGYTMGGGVGISANGQFRIACEDTCWAMPECAIGLFPDVGSSWFLSRLEHNCGIYLALTGKRLNHTEALACGLATHYLTYGMMPFFFERLMSIEEFEDEEKVNSILCEMDAEPEEPDNLTPHMDAIEKCFGQDSIEAVRSALEEEKAKGGDRGAWADETLSLLAKGAPTSLAVTLEQMKRGRQLKSLEECLKMEYRMTRRFLAKPDFYEGVRAMLRDKDKNPKWAPAPSQEEVMEFFKPLPKDQELQIPHPNGSN